MQFNGGYGDYDPEYDSDYDPEHDNEIDNEADSEIDNEAEPEIDWDSLDLDLGEPSIISTGIYDIGGNHKGSYIGVVREIESGDEPNSETLDDLVNEQYDELDETDDETDEEIEDEAEQESDDIGATARYLKNTSRTGPDGIRRLTDEEYDRLNNTHGHRVFWGSNGHGRLHQEKRKKRYDEKED